MTILARHNGLHYYQGFHDVCRVLLEVVFFDMAVEIGLFLAAGHLRDATTGSTLDKLSRSLDCLFPLVETRDLQLAKDLEQLDLMPHFGLQWLLTWGSHLSHEWSPVLFDAFLASEPDFQFPLYVAAAYTLSQRAAIGKLREEMGLIHQHLNSGLHLRTSSEVADVLQMAVSIRDQYPDPGVALCLSEKRKAWEAGAPKRLMIMRAAAASVPLVLAIAISYYLHNLKNS